MLVGRARMRRNPACTKALRELDDGAVRRKLYFLLDQHLVDACLLDRANAVAGHRQRAHESYGQACVERILAGEQGPERDLALLNAGAAIYAGGRADTLREGVEAAAEAVDSGAAAAALDALTAMTAKLSPG